MFPAGSVGCEPPRPVCDAAASDRHPRWSLAFALALASIAVSGCKTCRPPGPPPVPDVLAGYKLLSNPRSSIPIGAIWYQGQGPNGRGAASENVETVEGAAVLNFTQIQKRVLAAHLTSYIGLTGVQAKNVVVDLSDLKVVRVKDVFQLDVRTNDNILYEGISAGTMTFTYDRGLGLDVGGRFAVKGVPADATLTTGNVQMVTVHGSNLFLAHRVSQFVSLEESESKVMTDGTPDNMAVLARGLEITAGASAMKECALEPDVEACIVEAPIKMSIIDPKLTTIGGNAIVKDITYRMRHDRMKPFTVSYRKENELATGTVFVAKYIQFDIPMPRVTRPKGLIVAGDSDSPAPEAHIHFIPGASSGKLTDLVYELRELADPWATGWSAASGTPAGSGRRPRDAAGRRHHVR